MFGVMVGVRVRVMFGTSVRVSVGDMVTFQVMVESGLGLGLLLGSVLWLGLGLYLCLVLS